MPPTGPETLSPEAVRQRDLSTWGNEGGASRAAQQGDNSEPVDESRIGVSPDPPDRPLELVISLLA